MGKTVSVTYEVTCDTTSEYDDFLASLTGSPIWTVDASDVTILISIGGIVVALVK